MENSILPRNVKITIIVALVLFLMIYLLRAVVIPVAFSFLLAYFLDPVVDRFEEKKISRTLAIIILLIGALLCLTGVLLVLVPMIENQVSSFVERLPALIKSTSNRLVPYLEELTGMESGALLAETNRKIQQTMHGMSASQLAPVTDFIASSFTGTYNVLMAIVSLAIIPVFSFYFLRDFDTIKMQPLQLVPPRHKDLVVSVFTDIDEVLSSFIRGQVTVCIILIVLYGIGYTIAGVPLGILVGLIAGTLAFIPYLGAGIGLVLSLTLVLLDWQGIWPLVGLSIVFLIVSTLESFIITPKIVGNKVGLSPVMVIIALMVGAELFGFAGVLLAMPAAAVLNVLWKKMREYYQNTEYYVGE